jgi:hypothetical protein
MFLMMICCNKQEYYFGHMPFSTRWETSNSMAMLTKFKIKKKKLKILK